MAIITGQLIAGSNATLMARVSAPDGTLLKQSAVASITGTVLDEQTNQQAALTVTVSGAIYDLLQPWPNNNPDTIGYNFKYEVPGALLSSVGHFYFVSFALLLSDGTTTTIEYELHVQPVQSLYAQTGALSVSYHQLQSDIAKYLGWSRDYTQWTIAEVAEIDEILRKGLRQFYWPPPLADGTIVRWSFLSPQATLLLTVGTSAYDLPAGYAGNARAFAYQPGGGDAPLTPISEQQFRVLQASNSQTGKPAYYAVRPRPSGGTADQLWEVLFYPTPTDQHALSYRYDITPPMLSDAAPYPLGGAGHAKTVIESCLACAEEWQNDASAVHRERFQACLAASVKYDQGMEPEAAKDTWPVGSPPSTTIDLTYTELLRQVGQSLGFGWDAARWTRDNRAVADEMVQAGLRQFYRPPVMEGQPESHPWSFLTQNATLALAAGVSEYELPEDFSGQLIGGMTASAGSRQVHLLHVTDDKLRDLVADHDAAGHPQYFSLRPRAMTGAGRQGWKAVFYPRPEAVEPVGFQYIVIPPRLTVENPYPLGGVDHAETILASCLAAAEKRLKPGENQFQQQFKERLAASIQADSKASRTEVTWPIGDVLPDGLDVTYDLLLKRIGHEWGIGWDPGAWSIEERRRVDMAIQDGLRQFYTPAPLLREKYGHEWSFLRPIGTLTTEPGVSTYTLPADFAAIEGPLTFAPGITVLYRPIEILAEHQVRSRLAALTQTARPEIAAIRPAAIDGSGPTRYEILFWPTPNDAYVLSYRYRVNMLALAAGNQYPPGAEQHAQTILESCLAAVEMMKGQPGPHSAKLQERLAASVSADRKASSPEFLGYNRDQSDRPQQYPYGLHWFTESVVSYNGRTY